MSCQTVGVTFVDNIIRRGGTVFVSKVVVVVVECGPVALINHLRGRATTIGLSKRLLAVLLFQGGYKNETRALER